MYTIKIYYTTGDSFGSEDREDNVALVWKDKEEARQALAAIKEHYSFYTRVNSYSFHKDHLDFKEAKKLLKDKSWCAKDAKGNVSQYWEYSLIVNVDGKPKELYSGMWCGYFETLHGAEIILDPEVDTEDSFRL